MEEIPYGHTAYEWGEPHPHRIHSSTSKRKTFKELSFEELREKYTEEYEELKNNESSLAHLLDVKAREKRELSLRHEISKFKRRCKKLEKRIVEKGGNFKVIKNHLDGHFVDSEGNVLKKGDKVKIIKSKGKYITATICEKPTNYTPFISRHTVVRVRLDGGKTKLESGWDLIKMKKCRGRGKQ